VLVVLSIAGDRDDNYRTSPVFFFSIFLYYVNIKNNFLKIKKILF